MAPEIEKDFFNYFLRPKLWVHKLKQAKEKDDIAEEKSKIREKAKKEAEKRVEKLAEEMIVRYGMGKHVIYPSLSEKYKEQIDDEVIHLIDTAYSVSERILSQSKELIQECAEILKKNKIIKKEQLEEIITRKYPEILEQRVF